MKIGDRIYVRGYVDEIRKDTVIVRNNGGYFGMIPSEVITGELPPAQPEIIRCKDCKFWKKYGYINGKPEFLPKCGFNQIYTNKDDFCSRAERKNNG